jgi:hypothetical protein
MVTVEVIFEALVGVPAFIAWLVNLGKTLKWIDKPGQGELIAKILNTIFFVAVLVLANFFPEVKIDQIDQFLKLAADLGVYLLPLIPVSWYMSSKIHDLSRGAPIVGKAID